MTPTKLFFACLLYALCSQQLWATGIDIGNDRVIGEGASITLTATIDLPGLRDEVLPIKWYKRTFDQANYPATPFAEGAEINTITQTLTETTYFKVAVTDAAGVFCEDEVVVVVAKVYKIGFSASHPIYIDPTSPTAPPDLYVMGAFPANAHWIKTTGSIVPKPVCYTRNTVPQVQLMITADGLTPELLSTLLVKATCSTEAPSTPYNATLPATPLIPMSSGTTNGYGFSLPIAASAALPNQIDILEPLKIDWEIWDNTGVTWTNATANTPTLHQVYVTLGEPAFGTGTYPFRTTLDISCRQAKVLNDSNLENIVKAIYAEFTDKTVTTLGGTVLQFWGGQSLTAFPTPHSTKELLVFKDGTCESWAKFFMDMLKVQGFTHGAGVNQYESIAVSVTSNDILPDNAVFTNAIAQQALNNPLYNAPYTLGISATNPNPAAAVFYLKNQVISPNSFHNVIGGYPGTLEGVSGSVVQVQGYTTNTYPPMSNFTNHAIVEFAGKYYDPSYGSTIDGQPFSSIAQWQANSIIGYGSFFCPGQLDLDCRYEVPALQRIFWFKDNNFTVQEGVLPYE